MNHKPQILTRLSALSLLAVSAATVSVSLNPPVFALAVPQTETQDAPPKTDVSEAPALTESSLTAKEVFEGISRTLEESDSLSCDLTQTVIVGGQRLLATGRYVQAVGNRMRLEYRLYSFRSTKTADAQRLAPDGEPEEAGEAKVTGSLLQVNDGSVFWSLWINGDQKQLTRRNIPKITEAVADVANYSAARSLQDLGVGGVQTLMTQLQAGMEFGAVREQQVGESKLLVLSGRWTGVARKEYFQAAEDPNSPLPEYVPDYVRIYVDAQAMLPRRIQYLKKHPDPEIRQVRPMSTTDFREIVLNADVPEATFTFRQPEGEEVPEKDITSETIDLIRQIAQGNQPPVTPESAEEPANPESPKTQTVPDSQSAADSPATPKTNEE